MYTMKFYLVKEAIAVRVSKFASQVTSAGRHDDIRSKCRCSAGRSYNPLEKHHLYDRKTMDCCSSQQTSLPANLILSSLPWFTKRSPKSPVYKPRQVLATGRIQCNLHTWSGTIVMIFPGPMACTRECLWYATRHWRILASTSGRIG
jgi:hypothetical protein